MHISAACVSHCAHLTVNLSEFLWTNWFLQVVKYAVTMYFQYNWEATARQQRRAHLHRSNAAEVLHFYIR